MLNGHNKKSDTRVHTFNNLQHFYLFLKSIAVHDECPTRPFEMFKLINYAFEEIFPNSVEFLFPSVLMDIFCIIAEIICIDYDDKRALLQLSFLFVLMDIEIYKLLCLITQALDCIFNQTVQEVENKNYAEILNQNMIRRLYFDSKEVSAKLHEKSSTNQQNSKQTMPRQSSLGLKIVPDWHEKLISFISKNLTAILTISPNLENYVFEINNREFEILSQNDTNALNQIRENTDDEIKKLFVHILKDDSICKKDKQKYIKRMQNFHPEIYRSIFDGLV